MTWALPGTTVKVTTTGRVRSFNITDADDTYGNTVIAGQGKHARYDAILRNHYFRTDPAGLGMLINLAVMNNWQNLKIDAISSRRFYRGVNSLFLWLKNKLWFSRLIQKLREAESKK